jgi:chloramphenicol O-acetyltransferase
MNAGKAVIRGGVLVMPIAMTIHHGFIDGQGFGKKYYSEYQTLHSSRP